MESRLSDSGSERHRCRSCSTSTCTTFLPSRFCESHLSRFQASESQISVRVVRFAYYTGQSEGGTKAYALQKISKAANFFALHWLRRHLIFRATLMTVTEASWVFFLSRQSMVRREARILRWENESETVQMGCEQIMSPLCFRKKSGMLSTFPSCSCLLSIAQHCDKVKTIAHSWLVGVLNADRLLCKWQ